MARTKDKQALIVRFSYSPLCCGAATWAAYHNEDPNMVRTIVAVVTRGWARRQAIRQLNALSDHHLADIGVERWDISALVDARLAAEKAADQRDGAVGWAEFLPGRLPTPRTFP